MTSTRIRVDGATALVSYTERPNGMAGAIHLAGLPNSPFPIPGITEYATRRFLLLQPHYFGTYDSDGEFVPGDTDGTLRHWLDQADCAVSDLESGETFDLPNRWSLLSSHSFGTFPLLKTLLETNVSPSLALFMAPTYAFGSEAQAAGVQIDFERHARFIETAFPHTFRVPTPGTIASFFEQESQFATSYDSTESNRVPCVFIAGAEDPLVDAQKALSYAEGLCERFSDRLEFRDGIVTNGAGHDVAGLLDPRALKKIDKVLKKEIGSDGCRPY